MEKIFVVASVVDLTATALLMSDGSVREVRDGATTREWPTVKAFGDDLGLSEREALSVWFVELDGAN
jgi:hypothetical protein